MTQLVDITGRRFGSLTAVRPVPIPGQRTRWECACDCGGAIVTRAASLKNGSAWRCRDCIVRARREREPKHGMSRTRLYKVWNDMLQRCTNPKLPNFRNYGGKGVRVCDEWIDFRAFAAWALTHGYDDHLTIDRVDSGGHYDPANCRWITRSENARLGSLSRWAKQRAAAVVADAQAKAEA